MKLFKKIKNLKVKNFCAENEKVKNSSIVNADITNLKVPLFIEKTSTVYSQNPEKFTDLENINTEASDFVIAMRFDYNSTSFLEVFSIHAQCESLLGDTETIFTVINAFPSNTKDYSFPASVAVEFGTGLAVPMFVQIRGPNVSIIYRAKTPKVRTLLNWSYTNLNLQRL
jgi:hypothetical protein